MTSEPCSEQAEGSVAVQKQLRSAGVVAWTPWAPPGCLVRHPGFAVIPVGLGAKSAQSPTSARRSPGVVEPR